MWVTRRKSGCKSPTRNRRCATIAARPERACSSRGYQTRWCRWVSRRLVYARPAPRTGPIISFIIITIINRSNRVRSGLIRAFSRRSRVCSCRNRVRSSRSSLSAPVAVQRLVDETAAWVYVRNTIQYRRHPAGARTSPVIHCRNKQSLNTRNNWIIRLTSGTRVPRPAGNRAAYIGNRPNSCDSPPWAPGKDMVVRYTVLVTVATPHPACHSTRHQARRALNASKGIPRRIHDIGQKRWSKWTNGDRSA